MEDKNIIANGGTDNKNNDEEKIINRLEKNAINNVNQVEIYNIKIFDVNNNASEENMFNYESENQSKGDIKPYKTNYKTNIITNKDYNENINTEKEINDDNSENLKIEMNGINNNDIHLFDNNNK